MPEPTSQSTSNGHGEGSGDASAGSTPFELLRAVKEVQERRISIWREYEDAFDTFLSPPSSGPINGSQNTSSVPSAHQEPSEARGCAGCSTTTVPLSEDLLAQILQITTQALIECGHRLRSIQTELAHSSAPHLAPLVDRIQTKENQLLRSIVHRDQLRKSTLKPSQPSPPEQTDATHQIQQLDSTVNHTRAEIAELMQDVYAEIVDLQPDP